MSVEDSDEITPTPVFLHVYDVGEDVQTQAINSILETVGTGAFHCGVEVYGFEFSFNYKASGTGVFKCQPRLCPGHTYRTTVSMGYSMLSPKQVERVLYVLRQEWQGPDYHILHRNCCAFCDEFCKAMGVGSIPGWTTSLAGTAAQLTGVYKKVAGVRLTMRTAVAALGDGIGETLAFLNCSHSNTPSLCKQSRGMQARREDDPNGEMHEESIEPHSEQDVSYGNEERMDRGFWHFP